jgi:SpoVK/Ycf46/Vps4 family AAA+-type ATPase
MIFNDFKELIDYINKSLGSFTDTFGIERKRLAKLGKRPTIGSLYIYDSNHPQWAINSGGGTEIQYHIGVDIDEKSLIYGLGFNTQYVPFANEKSMVDYMKPYMNAFLSKEEIITQLLPDYSFVYGSKKDLIDPKPNKYVLFGKQDEVKDNRGKIEINDTVVATLLVDLERQFEAYKLIFETKDKNPNMDAQLISIAKLLRYKKQIILQGPPGTGKTKTAKELASYITGLPLSDNIVLDLKDDEILDSLNGVTEIPSFAGQVKYQIVKVDEVSKSVTLKKSSETEADTSFDKIKDFYKKKIWGIKYVGNDERRASAIAFYIFNKRKPVQSLESSDQFKIIQFHPSYSYEDFVRGIATSPNDQGDGILYEAENRLLASFAELANKNYKSSHKSENTEWAERNLDSQFDKFISHVDEMLVKENDHTMPLSPKLKLHITDVRKDSFHIASKDWKGDNLKFSQIKKLYKYNVKNKSELDKYSDIARTVYHRTSYYFPIVEKFREFIKDEVEDTIDINPEPPKEYVLIIDEINRANLSSVLGELIYALEYRGQNVESMYEVDGSNKLLLPENLLIIGTMNTADRSVGHIDYAIRRRFAFIPIPAKDLSSELGKTFKKQLFDKVIALCSHDTHLSREFDPADVQLGHSYFIDKSDDGGSIDIRLEYEIIPILHEYIKDGVLKDSEDLRKDIDELKTLIA